MMKRRPISVLLLAAAILQAGCDRQPTVAQESSREKLAIVATAYPLADIARQIGAPEVDVEWLCEAGQPAVPADPSEATRSRMRVADLVISSGESWAAEGFDNPFRALQVLRIDSLPAAKEPGAPGNGLIWLDPLAGIQLSDEIAQRLASARATRAPYFRGRADLLIADVRRIMEELGPKIEAGASPRVLVLSNDFNRLLWRFKVRAVHPVDGEPTALSDRQLREIREEARKEKVSTIIVSTDISAAAMRDLAERTGLKVIALDPLGSSSATGRSSYQELLRYNLEQLAAAVDRK